MKNGGKNKSVILFSLYIYIYIYIYIRGDTVHRCHGSVRTSVQGVTVQYNQYEKKKEIYYARFLFIYFEQTVVQIVKNNST